MHDVISKICCRCEGRKPAADFSKLKNTLDGYSYACKSCSKETREKSLKKQIKISVTEKQCNSCSCLLSIDQFYLNSHSKDGHGSKCKGCSSLEYKNKIFELQYCHSCNQSKLSHNFTKGNIDCITCIRKKSTKIFVEVKTCLTCKQTKNRTCFYPDYYRRDGLNSNCKECERASKKDPNTKKRNNKRRKERIKEIPHLKFKNLLTCRIIRALKDCGIKKDKRTEVLLGTTIKNCKIYLESKFIQGMTWDNYTQDGWHVDHIIPCASFDLTQESEQLKCFHYTNLMPRWATTEIAKANGSNQVGNVNKKDKVLSSDLIELF